MTQKKNAPYTRRGRRPRQYHTCRDQNKKHTKTHTQNTVFHVHTKTLKRQNVETRVNKRHDKPPPMTPNIPTLRMPLTNQELQQ